MAAVAVDKIAIVAESKVWRPAAGVAGFHRTRIAL